MSQFNYIKKPNFVADGALPRARGTQTASMLPSANGWVAPIPGKAQKITTSVTWGTGTVTVVATGHGLVSGQLAILVGVTPVAYNGLYTVTVTDANTFTFALASNPGTTTVQGKVAKYYEVVVACSGLQAAGVDQAVAVTYSAAVSYSGTAAMVTGNVMTVTLTASEPVEVLAAKINVVIGVNTRQLTYKDTLSTTTSLVFQYTIVAGDLATAGNITVATSNSAGYISDVLPANKKALSTVTFTSPNTSTATAN